MNKELIIELQKALTTYKTDNEENPSTLEIISNNCDKLIKALSNDDMNAIQIAAESIAWHISDGSNMTKKLQPLSRALQKVRMYLKAKDAAK